MRHCKEREYYLLAFLFGLWLIFPIGLSAQCTTTSASVIPDPGTAVIEIPVSGLTDSLLSSPTQGICRIDIEFEHEYLGDLSVFLISPDGTTVQLVGPSTTAILPTNLTVWDVSFIPCGSLAMPDAGFSAVWSNLQPWQALAFYNGSYHPYNGCLEAFASGPANGTWQIVAIDDTEFQVGTIRSVTLVFCNPVGIDCTPCLANAGVLSPDTLTMCVGEYFESAAVSVAYGGDPPSPTAYAYQFMLLSGDSILQHGNSFSASPPPGLYAICGISYALEDSLVVEALLDAGDASLVEEALFAGLYCGDLSQACISLSVLDLPDSLFATARLCAGESYTFRNQTYTVPGVYFQDLDGPGLCDTIARIDISTRSLEVLASLAGELGCGGEVTLSASATGSLAPLTFLWSTVNGHFITDPAQPVVQVDLPGFYEVLATDGICSGMARIGVPEGPGYPSIIAQGGVITCAQPVFEVRPVYVPSNGQVEWSGPGGFTYSGADVSLDTPGTYIVTILNSAGCVSADTIEILLDTLTAPLQIGSHKSCPDSLVRLTLATSLPYDSVWWSGPGAFNSGLDTIHISQSGLYRVTVEFPNGCRRTSAVWIDADFTLPDISVNPKSDSLNCGETILLTVMSMTSGAAFSWSNQQGQISAAEQLAIAQPGFYVASVTAPNACTAQDTVAIAEGSDRFDVQVIRDTIDCRKDTAVIGVIAPVADVFRWIGYAGADSLSPVIRVTRPGTYTVLMRDTLLGCEVFTSIVVPADTLPASFSISLDTLTCLDPVADLAFRPEAGAIYTEVYWRLPDFSEVHTAAFQASEVGTYRLFARSGNGCLGEIAFQLPVDTLGPRLLSEGGTIDCADTLAIKVLSPDSIVSFIWSGPDILFTADERAWVGAPGIYTVAATAVNGCPAMIAVVVDSNYRTPDVRLVRDSITCLGPATLQAISLDTALTYRWVDPFGQGEGQTPILQTTLPGLHRLVVIGPNRCVFRDSILLEPPAGPAVTVVGDTLTCARQQASLVAFAQPLPATFVWRNLAGDTISTSAEVSVFVPERVELIVTGPNGCTTMDTLRPPVDTLRPVAVIVQSGTVQCQNRDVQLDGSGSLPSGVSFQWSAAGPGQLIGDPTHPVTDVRDTGNYQLIIIDLKNGCADTTQWTVFAEPGSISQVLLDIEVPACAGDVNGSLIVLSAPGGTPPLAYAIDGGSFQYVSSFPNLSAGMHLLTVRDAGGCRYDTLVSLPASPAFDVYAGEDLEIYLGETVNLGGATDLPLDLWMKAGWYTLAGETCDGCVEWEVSPAETADFIFTVSSVTGCRQFDTIRIYVVEKPNYFIPDIFSPNGDQVNDELRLEIASGVSRVRQWVIYDRWGDAVFGRQDFLPGDPAVFWDGRTPEGIRLTPAVFVYLLEVELINGEIRLYRGDITLVR